MVTRLPVHHLDPADGSDGQGIIISDGEFKVDDLPSGSGGGAFVGARVTRSASYTFTSGAVTVFPFDAEDFDTDGFHDNTTNPSRLTVPTGKAGKYMVTAGFQTNDLNAGRVLLDIAVNGTQVAGSRNDATAASTEAAARNVATMVSLAVGDYVEARYFVNGSSKTAAFSAMTLVKVG